MDRKIADQARGVLISAEMSIRGLITMAADSQDYEAVSDLAELAKTLSSLAKTNRFFRAEAARNEAIAGNKAEDVATSGKTLRKQKASKSRKATKNIGAGKDYPKYHTERDRLVKIGWSKKHRDTYEHRAPKEAVEAVVDQLNQKAASGRAVTVEEIGAVHLPDGNEVPSYQVYMTIAWLLVIHQLEKEGRDGYRLDSNVNKIDLSQVWASTPIGGV
jgi:hypothetical protein